MNGVGWGVMPVTGRPEFSWPLPVPIGCGSYGGV